MPNEPRATLEDLKKAEQERERLDESWASDTSGVALTIYALHSLFGLFGRPFSVPKRVEVWLSPVIGLVAGLISGATGIFTIPAVLYPLRPHRQELPLSPHPRRNPQLLGQMIESST